MVKLTDAHFRALRWGLVGLCPDKKAFDFVMKHGADYIRSVNAASRPLPLQETEK